MALVSSGEQLLAEVTGKSAYLHGKPCPKCGYLRSPTDANPAWQCPKCHVAYLKHRPAGASLSARFVAGSHDIVADASADRSAYLLVATNLFALLVAYQTRMSLLDLMLVYWIQSLLIGASYFVRILSLKNFSVENPQTLRPPELPRYGGSNSRQAHERAEAFWEHVGANQSSGKLKVAVYFIVLYVVVHLVYFAVMRAHLPFADHVSKLFPGKGLYLCALAFAVNHAYSLYHNIRSDRGGRPNLRTVMSLPYYRILPMHALIALGGLVAGGTLMLFLFVGFKTVADVWMHTVEHRVLRKPAATTN